ncbi:MAG: aspartate/glutamate racemase family protein [Bacillota bacterium]
MLSIRLIRPVISDTPDSVIEDEVSRFLPEGVCVFAERIARGPRSIESQIDVAEAAEEVVKVARRAEAQGFHAAAIYCFADPGLEAARESTRIPVTGAGESSMLVAASLGVSFSVITVLGSLVGNICNTASRLGLSRRLASVRSVDIPVLGLDDRDRLLQALEREALLSVENDSAHVLILGCTGMTGTANALEQRLIASGHSVPVVDPAGACVLWAQMLAGLGLCHSRRTYWNRFVTEKQNVEQFQGKR